MNRFTGKRVIITGGASGIGLAIAKAFCQEGANVIIADLSQQAMQNALAEICDNGGKAQSCTVDVTDQSAVLKMVEQAGEKIDILVCVAGIFIGGTAEETALSDWQRIIDINLTGTFLCVQAVIPKMRNNGGGAIITISSSTGAHDAIPGAVAYVASKGGGTMLTKALAVDHAAENIRINSIAPGPTDTPMLRGLMDEEARQEFGQSLPINRLGTPGDFVGAALFLASEEAKFINGAILAVDGGQTALV